METTNTNQERGSELVLWLAFGAVYILWGSTYLALHFVLETMPPFLMAAFRFMIAGSIMLAFAKFSKQAWPTKEEFKNACIVGFLLLVVGNGGVVWAQQYIPSGVTALIVTIEPVWVVLLLWMKSNNQKPTPIFWLGILLGASGMFILVGASAFSHLEQLNPWGVLALLISSISWAVGSIYALSTKLPSSSSMSTGFQMLAAGICMLIIGSSSGEWINLELSEISTNSILGFLYLIIFGSLLGFTSYSYIVKKANPTNVSTYAYVNPIIAVFLGWYFGNERVESHTLVAAAFLISAVVLIIMKPELKFTTKYKKIKT